MDDLLSLICRELGIAAALDPDTPLISSGLADSLKISGLLSALQAEYGVRIDPADVGADNFDTPRAIQTFLQPQ